jgi:hypothetical protein
MELTTCKQGQLSHKRLSMHLQAAIATQQRLYPYPGFSEFLSRDRCKRSYLSLFLTPLHACPSSPVTGTPTEPV